jgi:hypothetical protein
MLTMVGKGVFLKDGRLVHACNNELAQTQEECQTCANNFHLLPKGVSVERKLSSTSLWSATFLKFRRVLQRNGLLVTSATLCLLPEGE